MSNNIGVARPIVARVPLAVCLGLIASVAWAQLPDHRHAVRARILLDDKLLFASGTAPAAITGGNPISVSILMRRVNAGQTAAPNPAGTPPLEGTYWRATELVGKPTPKQDASREAHLQFQAGNRLSGSDGCNRIAGSYQLKGDLITLGQMIGTLMACADTADITRAFQEALKGTTRLRIVGTRLELFDAKGTRVAAFAARAQQAVP